MRIGTKSAASPSIPFLRGARPEVVFYANMRFALFASGCVQANSTCYTGYASSNQGRRISKFGARSFSRTLTDIATPFSKKIIRQQRIAEPRLTRVLLANERNSKREYRNTGK